MMALTPNQRSTLAILRGDPQHVYSPAYLALVLSRATDCRIRATGAARCADRLVELGLAQRAEHPWASQGYKAVSA